MTRAENKTIGGGGEIVRLFVRGRLVQSSRPNQAAMASDDGRPSRWRWLSADYEYLSRLQLTGTSSLISAWPASALNVKRWIYSGGFYPDYRKQRC